MTGASVDVPQLLAAAARAQPDELFVTEVGGRGATHAQLHEEALRWAASLADAGIAPADRVLTMLPTCITAVACWLGTGWAGGVEVPVNTAYRGRMLRHVIEDSGARVLVVSARFADAVVAAAAARLALVVVPDGEPPERLRDVADEVVAAERLLPQRPPAAPPTSPRDCDIAAMIYTSGTTGASKGVLVPWAQLHATALGVPARHHLGMQPVAYVPFPLFHVSGKHAVTTSLVNGGRAVLREQFSTTRFWADIRAHGCTWTFMVSAMANFIHRQPPRSEDCSSPLRLVVILPLIPEAADFARRFGVRVETAFNMSEVSVPIATDGWDGRDTRTCGRLRDGYEARIVDEDDHEVPAGAVGELVLRTQRPWTLMAGYWNRPEETLRAWRNGWLHTGDAFHRDAEGNFFFVDRMKDAIRRRGENISSLEVEWHVLEHDDVLECAALGATSDEGEEEVKIVVVPKTGQSIDPSALHAWLEPRMPRFMVPRYIELREELPKTPRSPSWDTSRS